MIKIIFREGQANTIFSDYNGDLFPLLSKREKTKTNQPTKKQASNQATKQTIY